MTPGLTAKQGLYWTWGKSLTEIFIYLHFPSLNSSCLFLVRLSMSSKGRLWLTASAGVAWEDPWHARRSGCLPQHQHRVNTCQSLLARVNTCHRPGWGVSLTTKCCLRHQTHTHTLVSRWEMARKVQYWWKVRERGVNKKYRYTCVFLCICV